MNADVVRLKKLYTIIGLSRDRSEGNELCDMQIEDWRPMSGNGDLSRFVVRQGRWNGSFSTFGISCAKPITSGSLYRATCIQFSIGTPVAPQKVERICDLLSKVHEAASIMREKHA